MLYRATDQAARKSPAAQKRAGLSGTFKEGFAEMRVTAKPAAARTASARRHSELLQRISIFTLKMSATLKQFEDCAARCFEFARSATTTAGRARFLQMAREYQSAASLIHTELSADGGADRLGRGAEQWRGGEDYLAGTRADANAPVA